MVHAANKAKAAKVASGILETDEELTARAAQGSNTNWLHEHDVAKAFEETLTRDGQMVGNSDNVSAKL
jgi:salicylate hydroxylase